MKVITYYPIVLEKKVSFETEKLDIFQNISDIIFGKTVDNSGLFCEYK